MSLFQKVTGAQAFLKAGIYGFEGSGKSMTASLLAAGLCRHAKLDKPVAYFDTETGSDYVKELFELAGIELLAVKTHALAQLNAAIVEAEKECSVLIVDSLTHVYREVCSSYIRKKRDGTNYIRIQDWQPIKATWHEQFATPFVNSKLHVIWCSRAKNLFEDVSDEQAARQSGRKEFKSVQVGTGARTETETAYEPSILLELEKVQQTGHGRAATGAFERRMTVWKDRFNVVDGASFDLHRGSTAELLERNEPFAAILPHVERLNLGGDHLGYTPETSDELFADGEGSEEQRQAWQRRAVLLERLEAALTLAWPSTGGKDRKAKIQALEGAFGTPSWKEVKAAALTKLEAGTKAIEELAHRVETADDVEDPRAAAAEIVERIQKEAFATDPKAEVT